MNDGVQSLEISDTQFVNNTAFRAGAVFVTLAREVTVSNCRFQDNEATEEAGGAIVLLNIADRTTLLDNNFTGNTAK